MSTRTAIRPFLAINAGDMSASIIGIPSLLQSISVCSYSYSWTGTSPVGTLSIQASNDYSLSSTGQVLNAGTWSTLPFNLGGSVVTSIPISGNTGTGFVDLSINGFYAIRTVYTAGSGSGALTAEFVGKVS